MRTYGKKVYIGNRKPKMREVLREEQEYIIIGICIGIMIGYFMGLITPDLKLMLYGF